MDAWGSLQVGDVVHEGARCTVYRATRPSDDLRVILKVLRTGFDDAVHRARLERELLIASNVDGEAVVKAYGMATHEGRLALVLEDFGGESLSRILLPNAPLESTLPIAVGIAHALATVHRAGLVHRDVKPSNVIFRRASGQLKISDFGIAIRRGEMQAQANAMVEGTLAYMAPEQTGRMQRPVDRRADLYGFGVLLYELFTGKRPFHANDALEWIHCHAAQLPRPLTDVAPVPEALSRVVLKLLAKAPEERYQTAEGVERDLLRCLAHVQRGEPMRTFALAENDVSDEFKLPEHVFGRDAEIAALKKTFARVAELSHSEIVLVAGYSGIGKTSLVRELQGPLARREGYFASGKFEQYRRHVPYSAIAQAGSALVHQLLATTTKRLGAWRATLLEALDGNGRVLVDLIPDVERVLGRQPNVPELAPTGMQNRLNRVARAFLRAFDVPVVLFLDDLQWADPASLDLLEAVLAPGAQVALLAVLAYRDHEVGPSHPFTGVMDRARAVGTSIQSIVLGPLDIDAVRAMVQGTLHRNDEACDAMARMAMAKTAGNPFFVREFLRTLHLDGLLRFEAAHGRWGFDLAEVEQRGITENVVHLMVERLKQLAPSSQSALRVGAFLGSEFGVDDLAGVMGQSVGAIGERLRAAATTGLVTFSADVGRPGGARVRFGHDRIQQAAYALTDDAEKPAVHLDVAHYLWSRLDSDPTAGNLFEVANHLDASFALVTDAAERERMLLVFLAAARKAKSTTAYTQAHNYLTKVRGILSEAAWESRFELMFDVNVDLAECDYLAGHLDRAGALFTELLDRARVDLERARIYYLQIRLLQVNGNLAEAASLSIRSFALFGLIAPETPEDAARVVSEQYKVVDALIGDASIASLVDVPRMTDPNYRMLVDLLEASGPPLYMVKPALFPWIALELVIHSLKYGNAEASCYGYGIYALLRAAVLGDVEGGYAFSLLAIRVNEKLDAVKLEGCMLHLLGDHVNFWRNPISTDLPILERGFAACVRAGDHIYSNYIGFQSPWHLYETGAPLEDVTALTDKYLAFARETRYSPVELTIRAEQQFVLALKGETEGPGELGGSDFDVEAARTGITTAQFGCGIVYLAILQMVARYTFGDFAGARESAAHAAPELGSAFSMPMYATYGLYDALSLAARDRDVDDVARAAGREAIAAHLRTFEQWARACPANFADKAALIGAELARVKGDVPAALRLYEEARLAARAQGFVQYEALACELAGALYGQIGVESVRRAHLGDAHALYRRWGATGKADALAARDRGLHAGARSAKTISTSTTTASSTQSSTGREIDLTSVLKAAQSLSAEIVLPRLLARLMSIVIEYAGAERGSLLLLEGETLEVAAEAAIDDRREATNVARPRAAEELPASVLRYALRTGENVLIDDASVSNEFGNDPYFQKGKRRSVLCKPIEQQGRLIGLFYLENDLVAGAFGPSRLATLSVLASQTAISVENSRLYQASQAAVVARDEFLSIASHELRTPLAPLAMQIHRITSALRRGNLGSMSEDALAKMAATCDAQIVRLTRLVGALLDVSRLSSGSFPLQRESLDLSELVKTTLDAYSGELAAKQCALAASIELGIVGHWDRMRLEQVITNLVTNALKFGRGNPIEVILQKQRGGARLVITDHGVGVKREDQSRIFQRFERVQSSTNVDGLGLGLFIVRAIAEAHGGHVGFEETPGGGATFALTLPLA